VSVVLGPGALRLLAEARRATLATIGPDGRPRLVPCCFALVESATGSVIYTPIDDKPKASTDPRSLARVRDIERDPRVTLLVDRWDEEWARLAWVRIDGLASIVWPADDPDAPAVAAQALRMRYPQYAAHRLEELPVIAISPVATRSWFASSSDDDQHRGPE
jgi:PPOX class probable F420-dependent enzyme